MRKITVVDYNPGWPNVFEQLRSIIWPVVSDVAITIEHVGSTSIPGIAAKPVIDLSVVVRSKDEIPASIERLATLGYVHRGNLGIEGREAFVSPGELPAHHLYVCPRDSLGLANQLAFREYLRLHPEAAQEYAELKKCLARDFPNDIDSYTDAKTGLVIRILRSAGFTDDQLKTIEQANLIPKRNGKGTG